MRKFYRGAEVKLPKKLLYKNMYMIWSKNYILPLAFTYFVICIQDKKIITIVLKTVTFLFKTIGAYWYATN